MISYEDAQEMVRLLDDNQQKANTCRTCIGLLPDGGNIEWMKNNILSRLHDMEVNIAAIRQLYSTAVEE